MASWLGNILLWAIVIMILLPLGGCFAKQQEQLASCKVDVMQLYPGEYQATVPSSKIGDYIKACMGAHGYKFSLMLSACKPPLAIYNTDRYADEDPARLAGCYVPTSLIDRLIYRVEVDDPDSSRSLRPPLQ